MDSPRSSGSVAAIIIFFLFRGEYMLPSLPSPPVLDEILNRRFNGELRGSHGRILGVENLINGEMRSRLYQKGECNGRQGEVMLWSHVERVT